jgi:hypothetical protein
MGRGEEGDSIEMKSESGGARRFELNQNIQTQSVSIV